MSYYLEKKDEGSVQYIYLIFVVSLDFELKNTMYIIFLINLVSINIFNP